MNAVDFLKSQHREVEELFTRIEKTRGKSGVGRDRRELVNELSQKLMAHTKIEEMILYPEGKSVDEDLTLEAYEEHECVKSVIKKLARTRASDETFMAKVTVLKELVEHHVEEEEKEYFPKLKTELGEERLEQLGEDLETAFEKLSSRKSPKLTLMKAS